MSKQTDNHNPAAKLALRRYFVDKYHADGSARVLDCCQGGGLMWKELRKTHEVASYWGLDLKPKKGRLKLDSVRVLQQPGWNQNVIDIDTYGSPWKHWQAMLPNITQPTTVFLTIGQVMAAGGFQQFPREAVRAIGITDAMRDKCPATILARVGKIAINHCLSMGYDYGTILIEAVEAVSDGNARYIGCRVEPMKTPAPEVNTPTLAEQCKFAKGTSNV